MVEDCKEKLLTSQKPECRAQGKSPRGMVQESDTVPSVLGPRPTQTQVEVCFTNLLGAF